MTTLAEKKEKSFEAYNNIEDNKAAIEDVLPDLIDEEALQFATYFKNKADLAKQMYSSYASTLFAKRWPEFIDLVARNFSYPRDILDFLELYYEKLYPYKFHFAQYMHKAAFLHRWFKLFPKMQDRILVMPYAILSRFDVLCLRETYPELVPYLKYATAEYTVSQQLLIEYSDEDFELFSEGHHPQRSRGFSFDNRHYILNTTESGAKLCNITSYEFQYTTGERELAAARNRNSGCVAIADIFRRGCGNEMMKYYLHIPYIGNIGRYELADIPKYFYDKYDLVSKVSGIYVVLLAIKYNEFKDRLINKLNDEEALIVNWVSHFPEDREKLKPKIRTADGAIQWAFNFGDIADMRKFIKKGKDIHRWLRQINSRDEKIISKIKKDNHLVPIARDIDHLRPRLIDKATSSANALRWATYIGDLDIMRSRVTRPKDRAAWNRRGLWPNFSREELVDC